MIRSRCMLSCLLTIFVSCSRFSPDTGLDNFAGAQGSQWLTGDFLVHSGASADAPPTVTVETYRMAAGSRKLDYFVLLDHSNSTGSLGFTRESLAPCEALDSMDARSDCVEEPQRWNRGPDFANLANSGFDEKKPWLFGGSQYTLEPLLANDEPQADTRIGCVVDGSKKQMIRVAPKAITDRSLPAITAEASVKDCHNLGGIAFRIAWRGSQDDDVSVPYDGILVLDARLGYSKEDTSALQGLLARTAKGEVPAALGASASHQGGRIDRGVQRNPVGSMLTSIMVTSSAAGSFASALRASHTVAHTPATRLDARVYDGEGSYYGTVGDRLKLQTESLVLRIQATSSRPLNLYLLWFDKPSARSTSFPDSVDEISFVCRTDSCELDYSTQIADGAPRSCVIIAASSRIWEPEHKRPEEIAIASPVSFYR